MYMEKEWTTWKVSAFGFFWPALSRIWTEEEKEIEKPNEILEIVKDILKFNK